MFIRRSFATLAATAAFTVYASSGLSAREEATSADAFVDTIGMNVHMSYTDSAYVKEFPAIVHDLEDLGIRHIRDGALDTSPRFYGRLKELGDHGIKSTLIFSEKSTPDLIRSYPSRIGNAFEAYEGPNEYNQSRDPDWVTTLQNFQKLLYTTVKSDPDIAQFPVIGPSITSREGDAKLGDLSASMDLGNLHNYFGGRHPGTIGWGPKGYGSYDYNMRYAAIVSAAKPFVTTETGYCNLDTGNGSPIDVNAVYEPRLFLDQLKHNILRTFQYELIDQGRPNSFGSYCGLLTSTLDPKPSYTALKSMIHLLADPGPSFKPDPLDISIASSDPNVQSALFEKRDGSYYLALWDEVAIFDPRTQTEKPFVTKRVTLTLSASDRSATQFTYDSTGTLHGRSLTIGRAGATIDIDGHVQFIKIPHA